MVAACCTFGNSMTLPLVFLGSLLPPPVAARAVGYLALYQMAWSPLLWALGPRMLRPSGAAPLAPLPLGNSRMISQERGIRCAR